MKILFFTLFLSSSIFAASCPSQFADTTLNGLYESGYSDEPRSEFYYQKISSAHVSLSLEEFMAIPVLGDQFDYEECKDAIIEFSFFDIKTKEEFSGYYTFDDRCDGGNSSGSIQNSEGIYIAEIGDGEFSCFK